MTEIRALQEIIAKFKSILVDATEYACLKGIVLFKTGERVGHSCFSYTHYRTCGTTMKLLNRRFEAKQNILDSGRSVVKRCVIYHLEVRVQEVKYVCTRAFSKK